MTERDQDIPKLTRAQQDELLSMARRTIATYLGSGTSYDYRPDDTLLTVPAGAFVTLRSCDRHQGYAAPDSASGQPSPGRNLRGCIGRVQADLPLYQVVQKMAVKAATADPRLPPVTLAELDYVWLEISILSPLKPITKIEQIQVGTHGLMIVKDSHRGLLLPQVPALLGWNRELFLENLCHKAGLPADCWRDDVTLYAFTTLEFDELRLCP